MGPMGPMMGGPWGGGTTAWLVLVVLLVLALGLVALVVWDVRGERRWPRSPDEILRERYARGELGRQEYLDALADVLKDRYIRGELTSDEYETRLGLLLREPAREMRQGLEQQERPVPRR